jgi:integrase
MPPKPQRRSDLPRYVQRVVARGHAYLYFRHDGQRWPLPADPASPEFHEAYAQRLRAIDDAPAPRRFEAGTIGAMMADYKASAEYLALADKTRHDYARMLDRLEPVAGEPADAIRRAHVRELALDLVDTPRTHKLFTQVVSRLFSFGIDNDYCLTNPAARMKRIGRAVSYTPWSDEACATFEAAKPEPWMMRAYMLARYTGQRLGDVLAMTWRAYDGQGVYVAQEKTERTNDPIWICAHRRLRAYLDGLDRDQLLIITMPSGRGWNPDTASKYFNSWLDEIGIGDLNFHGLRHRAGTEMADAGCSDQMIKAVLGHKTLQMVQLYTMRANQRRLSTAAVKRLESKGRG